MLEVLIDNKDGNVWDVSDLVSDVTWKTSRIGRAGSLDMTMLKGDWYQDKNFTINNGDIIQIRKDNFKMFYGYVFEIDSGQDEDIKIKAYDQIRYLMANDTYVFKNATATQAIQQIARDFELKIGNLTDTGYKIPALVEDNKKLLDIIYKALDLTLIATGRHYVLYDDFGQLTLKYVNDLTIDFAIGDESLMYEYGYKRSIDDDTYNKVKIVQDNKNTGQRDVYIVRDSANIAKWGALQLYQSVDENMNEAQINDQLDALIKLKNRENKKLKINAIGDIRIRAGYYIPIFIEELGVGQYFLINECTHKFEGADHSMTLDLKVI